MAHQAKCDIIYMWPCSASMTAELQPWLQNRNGSIQHRTLMPWLNTRYWSHPHKVNWGACATHLIKETPPVTLWSSSLEGNRWVFLSVWTGKLSKRSPLQSVEELWSHYTRSLAHFSAHVWHKETMHAAHVNKPDLLVDKDVAYNAYNSELCPRYILRRCFCATIRKVHELHVNKDNTSG